VSTMNGKKPLSAKASTKAAPLNMDDIFGNPLALEPELIEAITKNGHAYRFINSKQLQSMGGHHPRGWRPLHLEQLKKWGYDKMGTHGFIFGQAPEPYIFRGDCVLATRPKELNDRHKAFLRQEAKVRSMASSQRAQAKALREFVKDAGMNDLVHEGYEDENEET
jgi:hypothetical protein